MCSPSQLDEIINKIVNFSKKTFEKKFKGVVLYGSYARGDYDEESDIDIMIMVDIDRTQTASYRKIVSAFCTDIDIDYGVLLAPIVQSKPFFDEWKTVIPFYKNIEKEGIMYA